MKAPAVFVVSLILLLPTFAPPFEIDQPGSANLLANPSFEAGTTRDNLFWTPAGGPFTQAYGEIGSPEDWLVWWHEYFPCTENPDYHMGRPESLVVRLSDGFPDAERVLDGDAAVKMFTFYRCHKYGILQQVAVTPGAWYEFSAYVHAWYSRCSTRPHAAPYESDCVTPIDWAHDLLRVGIDSTGGIDPDSPNVVWSDQSESYGVYETRRWVQAQAAASTVTVFVESVATQPLQNNDDYIDRAELVEIDPTLLLRNPSFEEGTTWDVRYWTTDGGPHTNRLANIEAPVGWSVWWYEGIPCADNPDYTTGRPATDILRLSEGFGDPERILSGDAAASVYTSWKCHKQGLLQQANVLPGWRYEFSIYVHSWYSRCTSQFHTPPYDSDCLTPLGWASDRLQVGIDPYGGTDPDSPHVVWGNATEIYGTYGGRLSVEAEAAADTVTVFVKSVAGQPLQYNNNYFDHATLGFAEIYYFPVIAR